MPKIRPRSNPVSHPIRKLLGNSGHLNELWKIIEDHEEGFMSGGAHGERATVNVPMVAAIVLASIGAYLLLARWSRRLRARFGIAGGSLLSADDSLLGAPNLYSDRHALVGRRDHMLRMGRAYVPVEHKPTAGRLQDSHVLQVGALCLLIKQVYRTRPPYGLVVLAGGQQKRVPFTNDLERRVLSTMAKMHQLLASAEPPGPRWQGSKCCACGYHAVCWKPG